MSKNYNIPTSSQTIDQKPSAKEEALRWLKRSGALGLIAISLFAVGKGLEHTSDVREEAAITSVEHAMDNVPEAAEGTFVGDILEGTVRSKSGGLSGNIELAQHINEHNNSLTPMRPEDVSPSTVGVYDYDRVSEAMPLADSEGKITYSTEADELLSEALVSAKASETADTAADIAAAGSAVTGLSGGAMGAAAATLAMRDKKKQ